MFEGCNEIIFNPLIKWWRHGPISRQLRTFVWSNAPIHYKIGMMSCTWMFFFFFVGCRTLIPSYRSMLDMFSYCEFCSSNLNRSDLVAGTCLFVGPVSNYRFLLLFPSVSFGHLIDAVSCVIDGIAAATFGSIMNYLLLGLGPGLDRFYLHSFEILLACTVVFPGIGNLGYTLLEVRLGQRNFFAAMFENLRWIPFL